MCSYSIFFSKACTLHPHLNNKLNVCVCAKTICWSQSSENLRNSPFRNRGMQHVMEKSGMFACEKLCLFFRLFLLSHLLRCIPARSRAEQSRAQREEKERGRPCEAGNTEQRPEGCLDRCRLPLGSPGSNINMQPHSPALTTVGETCPQPPERERDRGRMGTRPLSNPCGVYTQLTSRSVAISPLSLSLSVSRFLSLSLSLSLSHPRLGSRGQK